MLMFSLGLYAISGTSGFWLNDLYFILLGRVFLGVAVAGIMTIAVTLVGNYFSGLERNFFMGIQGAFVGLGGVLFISLAGIFADIHWQMPFLIYLFSLPMLILGLFFLYEPQRHKPNNELQTQHPQLVSSNKSQINVIYLLIFLGIIFFYMMPVQIPFLLDKHLCKINCI